MIAAALLACAMNVHPVTIDAVVRVESGGDALAIHVNGLPGPQPHPVNFDDAVRIAKLYISRGFSTDLGLTQINSRNLGPLGLTVEQAFDPCANINGGARILTADYVVAVHSYGEGQAALQAALSAYNTGSQSAGFLNGYVARYYGQKAVPALARGIQEATAIAARARRHAPPPPNPFTAATEVAFTEGQNVQFAQ